MATSACKFYWNQHLDIFIFETDVESLKWRILLVLIFITELFGICFSNFRSSWLIYDSNRAVAVQGKTLRRRSLEIRAEVDFVNAEEAKQLIAVEGYAILDVRDKSQYERAHIKSCHHVPLFIENKDNDIGKVLSSTCNIFYCSMLFHHAPFFLISILFIYFGL